jgi:hypothetical protein
VFTPIVDTAHPFHTFDQTRKIILMTIRSILKFSRSTSRKSARTAVLFSAFLCLLLFATQTGVGQASRASVILTPESGFTFASSTVTFTWEDVGAVDYILRLGTQKEGLNIHNSGLITNTSRTVSGLSTNTVVHATLWTRIGTGSSFALRNFVYNVDLDGDGIEDTIDPNLGIADPKVTFTGEQAGENYTLTLLGSGRVASLEVSQTLYDALISFPGAPPHMTLLSRMIYNQLRDRFDFILLVSNEDSFPTGLYSGIHGGAKNDIAGIGRAIFDSTANYGSAGRLQSVIHLPAKIAIAGGPSLHEIMHRWGNHSYIASIDASHWGYSSGGGQLGGWANGTLEWLGGNLYRANNGRTSSFGTFANGGNAHPFSPLERYLMGLIEAADVHDIQRAINPAATPTPGQFTAASIETNTMAQLVAQRGARVPGVADSQKVFSALWVVITTSPLANGRWASYDRDVYDISFPGAKGASSLNFWEATGGLAELKSDGLLDAAKTSLPAVVSISEFFIQGNDAVARFFADSGVLFRLEHSEDMQLWETVGSQVEGNDQVREITHSGGAAGPQGFYRLDYELGSAAAIASAEPSLPSDKVSAGDAVVCTCDQNHSGGLHYTEMRLRVEP